MLSIHYLGKGNPVSTEEMSELLNSFQGIADECAILCGRPQTARVTIKEINQGSLKIVLECIGLAIDFGLLVVAAITLKRDARKKEASNDEKGRGNDVTLNIHGKDIALKQNPVLDTHICNIPGFGIRNAFEGMSIDAYEDNALNNTALDLTLNDMALASIPETSFGKLSPATLMVTLPIVKIDEKSNLTWKFHYSGRTISARIEDYRFLQFNDISALRRGDYLIVNMRIRPILHLNGIVNNEEYTIERIIGGVHYSGPKALMRQLFPVSNIGEQEKQEAEQKFYKAQQNTRNAESDTHYSNSNTDKFM